MAQFGRALRSGRRGRWFKSSQPDQSMRRDRFLRSLFLASVVIPRSPRYTHSSLSRCIVEVYMFGLRAPELIIILVVVLIIFGPKNLPKLGKSLGSTVKNIRDMICGKDLLVFDEPTRPSRPRRSWSSSPRRTRRSLSSRPSSLLPRRSRQRTATRTQSSPIPLG